MGVTARIYTDKHQDIEYLNCDTTAGGFSGRDYNYKGVCIMNVEGPFVPDKFYYPVLLVCDKVSKYCKVVPARQSLDGWVEDDTTMKGDKRGSVCFGGNYCSGDSRIDEYIKTQIGHCFWGAIPIHDRIETEDMQKLWRD